MDGPYPNPKSHPCSLVNMAFERDGIPIRGSDVVRFDYCEEIHSTFDRSKYPNQPEPDHGLNKEELWDVFYETMVPGGKAVRHRDD